MEGIKKRELDKKPITSTLRKMSIGRKVVFTIEQRDSVANTISTRMYKEKREGMSWSYRTDNEKGIVTVTRES